MRITLVALMTAACLTVGAACGESGGGARRDRLQVVATTTQLTDFMKVIAGSRAEIYDVVKPDVDAHDFEPSPSDLVAMRRADLIVRNGVGLEQWFEATIDSAGPQGLIVDASRGVQVLPRRRGEDGARDPHIWLDPRNAKVMVANLVAGLMAVDPGGAAVYRANQRTYEAQLDTLDLEIAAQIGRLANKKFVSNHDAFRYYLERYGLEFVGAVIPSFDSQAELSSADIAALVRKIKGEGVKAIFSEASVPARTARTIATEAGVKVVAGEDSLYSDALGPPGSDGDTYLGMLRHNTRVIVENLR